MQYINAHKYYIIIIYNLILIIINTILIYRIIIYNLILIIINIVLIYLKDKNHYNKNDFRQRHKIMI